MRNETWANYMKDKRRARNFTRRHLASLAKVDPSYLTLIERDGCIPRRDKVLSFAEILSADPDEMLLMAGYAPNNDSFINSNSFTPELLTLVKKLSELDKPTQIKVGELIKSCLNMLEQT